MSHSIFLAKIAIGPFLIDHTFNVYFKSIEEAQTALKGEDSLVDLVLSLAVTNPEADASFEKTTPNAGLAISLREVESGKVAVAGWGEAADVMVAHYGGEVVPPKVQTIH